MVVAVAEGKEQGCILLHWKSGWGIKCKTGKKNSKLAGGGGNRKWCNIHPWEGDGGDSADGNVRYMLYNYMGYSNFNLSKKTDGLTDCRLVTHLDWNLEYHHYTAE